MSSPINSTEWNPSNDENLSLIQHEVAIVHNSSSQELQQDSSLTTSTFSSFPMVEQNIDASDTVPLYMQHMTIILVILHMSVFITGLVGNSLVCLSVYRNKSLQTVTNYYIVNLAVADFSVILICLPPTVYWDLTLTWNFGLVLCKLVLYMQSTSVSVSVLTLTCISIDRWYAICRPLEFSSTKYRAKITIGLIWLASMLFASPDLIYLTTRPLYQENNFVYQDCTYSWPEANTKMYQLCIVTLLFIGPFILMSISYSHIVNVLWRNESMALESINESAQLEEEQQQFSRRKLEFMSLEDSNNHNNNNSCNFKKGDNRRSKQENDHHHHHHEVRKRSDTMPCSGSPKMCLLNDESKKRIKTNHKAVNIVENDELVPARKTTTWISSPEEEEEEAKRRQRKMCIHCTTTTNMKEFRSHQKASISATKENNNNNNTNSLRATSNNVRDNDNPIVIETQASTLPEHISEWREKNGIAENCRSLDANNNNTNTNTTCSNNSTVLVQKSNCKKKNHPTCHHHHHHHHRQHHQHHHHSSQQHQHNRHHHNHNHHSHRDHHNNWSNLKFSTQTNLTTTILDAPNSELTNSCKRKRRHTIDQFICPNDCGSILITNQNHLHHHHNELIAVNQTRAIVTPPFTQALMVHENDDDDLDAHNQGEFCKKFQQHTSRKFHEESSKSVVDGKVNDFLPPPSHQNNDILRQQNAELFYLNKSEVRKEIKLSKEFGSSSERIITLLGMTDNNSRPSGPKRHQRFEDYPSVDLVGYIQSTVPSSSTVSEGAKEEEAAEADEKEEEEEVTLLPKGLSHMTKVLDNDPRSASEREKLISAGTMATSVALPKASAASAITAIAVDGTFSPKKCIHSTLNNNNNNNNNNNCNCNCNYNYNEGANAKIDPLERKHSSTSTSVNFTAPPSYAGSSGCVDGGADVGRKLDQVEEEGETITIMKTTSCKPTIKTATVVTSTSASNFNSNQSTLTLLDGQSRNKMQTTKTRTIAPPATSLGETYKSPPKPEYAAIGARMVNNSKKGCCGCFFVQPLGRKSDKVMDDKTLKKYRRNLANYAATRDKYREQSSVTDLHGERSRGTKQTLLFSTNYPSLRAPETSGNLGPAQMVYQREMKPAEVGGGSPQSSISRLRRSTNTRSARATLSEAAVTLVSSATTKQDEQTTHEGGGGGSLGPNHTFNPQVSCQKRFYKLIESRKKAAKMLIVIVIMFGLCYLPVHFLNILRYTTGLPQNDITTIASLVSHWLCYFNSAVNPLIYNFMSDVLEEEDQDEV